MKLIGIVGTNAEKSYNRQLLTFMQRHFADQAEIEILEIKDVPMFNESADQNLPIIQTFDQKIIDADGVIISTPEHNHSIPSALKSTLEWLSNDVHSFEGKPVMIVGASYHDQGSSRAQLHLRQILDAPGIDAIVMPGNEFLLGHAQQAFDEHGDLNNEGTVSFLASCFKKFLRFTNMVKMLNVPEDLKVNPGTYDVTAMGHNGKLPMSVEFSEDKIENIEIDTSAETAGIADVVFEKIPAEILSGQTLNVDTVSGASVTSKGVIDGVAEAVKLAGGDPDVLKNRPRPSAKRQVPPVEYETDVVVIGAGGAGLTAAASVLQRGQRVIVAEKFPSVGGNTVRTGGPMNAADPTWQNEFSANPGERTTLQGILNTDEATIDPAYVADFRLLKTQITKYLETTDDDNEYLFDSTLFHRIQTYLGGKRVDLAGHEIHGQYDLVKILTDHALESVKWLESIGVEFDQTEVSMPVGAKWRRGHKPLKNQGYAANTKMVQQYNTYWQQIDDDIQTSNSPAITGDGIKLGTSAGADLVGMGFSQMMPVSDPETGELFTGLQVPPANFVMVNQQGKRFVNEYEGRDVLSKAAIANGSLFYLIADDKIKETAYNTSQEKIDQQVEDGTLYRANTLAELAQQIHVDPAVLTTTIAHYNSYVDAGTDPEFGKNVFDLKVEQAPFYATPRKPAIHHTMGGLRIDTQAHVLNEQGTVIPHLFAAGEVAGGIHAGNRLGGNSLTDIFTFGRVAGKTAVSENQK